MVSYPFAARPNRPIWSSGHTFKGRLTDSGTNCRRQCLSHLLIPVRLWSRPSLGNGCAGSGQRNPQTVVGELHSSGQTGVGDFIVQFMRHVREVRPLRARASRSFHRLSQ